MLKLKLPGSRLERIDNIWGYIFILPWLFGFFALTLYPMLFSIRISLSNWNILGRPRYIGFDNFIDLFYDERVRTALYNTIYMAALNIPLCTAMALGLALLVNSNLKCVSIFRTVYYLPSVVSGISLMMVWTWILDPSKNGLANMFLGLFGLGPLSWLKSEAWSKPSLVLMQMFLVGGGMVVFLAALKNVPAQLYESAEIDGASAWTKFTKITLPMISPTMFFQVTMGIIGYFQNYAANFIMTGGGPANSSLVLGLLIWRQAFEWYRMGSAAALSWILFGIIMVFTIFQLIGSRRWVYYEAAQGGDES